MAVCFQVMLSALALVTAPAEASGVAYGRGYGYAGEFRLWEAMLNSCVGAAVADCVFKTSMSPLLGSSKALSH